MRTARGSRTVPAAAALTATAALAVMAGCTTAPASAPPPTSPTAPRPAPTRAHSPASSGGGAMDGDQPGGGPTGTPATPTGNPEAATATPHRTPLPPGATGTPRGAAHNKAAAVHNRADANQVATGFAVRLNLWDTRIDHRPNDAAKRAAPLATAKLRDQMLSGAPVAAPGRRWNALAGHDGYTTATAQLGGVGEAPSDSPTQAWRIVTVTAADHGHHHWHGQTSTTTYAVELVRTHTANPWYVAQYRIM